MWTASRNTSLLSKLMSDNDPESDIVPTTQQHRQLQGNKNFKKQLIKYMNQRLQYISLYLCMSVQWVIDEYNQVLSYLVSQQHQV